MIAERSRDQDHAQLYSEFEDTMIIQDTNSKIKAKLSNKQYKPKASPCYICVSRYGDLQTRDTHTYRQKVISFSFLQSDHSFQATSCYQVDIPTRHGMLVIWQTQYQQTYWCHLSSTSNRPVIWSLYLFPLYRMGNRGSGEMK